MDACPPVAAVRIVRLPAGPLAAYRVHRVTLGAWTDAAGRASRNLALWIPFLFDMGRSWRPKLLRSILRTATIIRQWNDYMAEMRIAAPVALAKSKWPKKRQMQVSVAIGLGQKLAR